ncbi:hypothetical protein D3C71_196680 [compost metagenome]
MGGRVTRDDVIHFLNSRFSASLEKNEINGPYVDERLGIRIQVSRSDGGKHARRRERFNNFLKAYGKYDWFVIWSGWTTTGYVLPAPKILDELSDLDTVNGTSNRWSPICVEREGKHLMCWRGREIEIDGYFVDFISGQVVAAQPEPVDFAVSAFDAPIPTSESDVDDIDKEVTIHTRVQGVLARMAFLTDRAVWIPKADRKRLINGKALDQKASLLPELPSLLKRASSQEIIENIDVVWVDVDSHTCLAAFEVETTTSVYSGLLRMMDLMILNPNNNIPLFIVAPSDRIGKFAKEVTRPSFNWKKGSEMTKRCRFLTTEELLKQESRSENDVASMDLERYLLAVSKTVEELEE